MTQPLTPNLLRDARVYLSGPMDFVASRDDEKKTGWRNRVGEFLKRLGVTVFDPWFKPELRGLHEYGREDETTTKVRQQWTFEPGAAGAAKRASVAESFWPALHVDLRMVDTSDFVIARCPTNVYSVGTPHEIVMARLQRKPVLFVSPPVTFPMLGELRKHLKAKKDAKGAELLDKLLFEAALQENEKGAPSLWYLPLVGGEHFFDGFGWGAYREEFGWPETALDRQEADRQPLKPLLPFLAELNQKRPAKWCRQKKQFVSNDDWLLWRLSRGDGEGAEVEDVHEADSERA
jgi:hypothetical protein